MTKKDQIQMVKALCRSAEEEMIKKINKGDIPESWDGFELRHWLNRIVQFNNIWSDRIRNKPYRKRIRDCNNTMIVNNLY